MSSDYPLMLRLAGRRCVVVGGGTVALRRTQRLVACEADILVVAPEVRTEIEAHAEAGMLHVERRAFEPSDLDGAVLAFAATDNRAVNRAVAEAARTRGALVNVADDPDACDFTLPASVRRREITLAVSTGGQSPAYARFLREELEAWLTDERCTLLEVVAERRRVLRAAGMTLDRSRWQAVLDDDALRAAARAGNVEAAQQRLVDLLDVGR